MAIVRTSPAAPERPPAFVISLDFELHWGVSERVNRSGHPYMANLHGTHDAVLQMLDLFEKRRIHATWATVGKLMAHSRNDLESFKPEVRPAYEREAVDNYRITVGDSEKDDPLHLAPSLVDKILRTPGQELASHTFSHYFCDEPGQDVVSFAADLAAAQRIAARIGVQHRSLVFPRNQVSPDYLTVLEDAGIVVYRGNPPGGLFRRRTKGALGRYAIRSLRLADSFLNLTGHHTLAWDKVAAGSLSNVCASQLLRPYSRRLRLFEPLRLRRIKTGLHAAAKRGEIFHIWWHPHNFGVNHQQNIDGLANILDTFEELRESHGMQSLTMAEVADLARQDSAATRS